MQNLIANRANVAAVLDLIGDGAFFSVTFVKRTNGEVRTMNCRTGVKCHLTGAGARYSFTDKGLVSVWSVDANGYRCFPVDRVSEIRAHGKVYRFMWVR